MSQVADRSAAGTVHYSTLTQMSVWVPGAILFALCGLSWLLFIVFSPLSSYLAAALLMLAVVIPPVAAFVFLRATANRRWALSLMTFAVIFLSDSALRAKAAGDTGLDAQSLVKLSVWFAGVLFIPWASTTIRKGLRIPPLGILFAFGCWSVLGSVYSITPAYTFAAGMSFVGMFVLAVVSAERLPTATALRGVLVALAAALAVSLLMYLVVPDRAMTPMEGGTIFRLSGFFGSPNNLGRAAALTLLLVAVQWFYGTRRVCFILTPIIVPLALACLYLSGSRASLIGLFAGVGVVMATKRPKLTMAMVAALTLGTLVFLSSPWDLRDIMLLISRSGRQSEVLTLTGRTEIWSWVLNAIYKSPFLGYGFASTRELIPSGYFAAYGWTTTSAHNMWLQAWVTTGLIGLALVGISQLAALREIIVRPDPLRDSVTLFILAVGLLEAGPVGPSVNLLTFVWIWALASNREGFHKVVA